MATTAKRAARPARKTAGKTARKSSARKSVKKSAARKTALTPKRKPASGKPAKKSAVRKAVRKAVSKTVVNKAAARQPAKKPAAKLPAKRKPVAVKKAAKGQTAPQKTVRPADAKPHQPQVVAPAKHEAQALSPEAKKDLAAKHLWELVQEKKRRAAQPQPWQNIGHHDHAASPPRTVEITPPDADPEKFHIGGRPDRDGG